MRLLLDHCLVTLQSSLCLSLAHMCARGIVRSHGIMQGVVRVIHVETIAGGLLLGTLLLLAKVRAHSDDNLRDCDRDPVDDGYDDQQDNPRCQRSALASVTRSVQPATLEHDAGEREEDR